MHDESNTVMDSKRSTTGALTGNVPHTVWFPYIVPKQAAFGEPLKSMTPSEGCMLHKIPFIFFVVSMQPLYSTRSPLESVLKSCSRVSVVGNDKLCGL